MVWTTTSQIMGSNPNYFFRNLCDKFNCTLSLLQLLGDRKPIEETSIYVQNNLIMFVKCPNYIWATWKLQLKPSHCERVFELDFEMIYNFK